MSHYNSLWIRRRNSPNIYVPTSTVTILFTLTSKPIKGTCDRPEVAVSVQIN